MMRTAFRATAAVDAVLERDWVTLPGGELEGRRPVVWCPECREKQVRVARASGCASATRELTAEPTAEPLCFGCYRASVARERALKAARDRIAASERQFQWTLPFEPVDQRRLTRLKVERAGARAAAMAGIGRFANHRRHAQIQARHALQRIVTGLRTRQVSPPETLRARADDSAHHPAGLPSCHPAMAAAVLPDAWLPFAGAR